MGRGVSDKTKKLTASAVLAAMGVVLLMLGAIEVLDISMAALASFFCIFAVIELGRGYSFMIYAVTGILSVVLLPQSLAGWFYIIFFGYYPILKEIFEKLSKTVAWILKLLIFNIAVTAYSVVFFFMFSAQFQQTVAEISGLIGGAKVGVVAVVLVYAVLNVVFIIYDIALTRLITLYFVKLRRKFRFLK